MDEIERRQELAAFLRTRRERLSPTAVELPAHSRSRTPGLRREEVAELANRGLPDGPRSMIHPTLGDLEFDHVTFQTTSDLRVKVYAASFSTLAKIEQALATSS